MIRACRLAERKGVLAGNNNSIQELALQLLESLDRKKEHQDRIDLVLAALVTAQRVTPWGAFPDIFPEPEFETDEGLEGPVEYVSRGTPEEAMAVLQSLGLNGTITIDDLAAVSPLRETLTHDGSVDGADTDSEWS